MTATTTNKRSSFRWSLWIGLTGLIIWLNFIPDVWNDPKLRLLGVWLLTVYWWITEPLPIAITGLAAVAGSFLLGIPQQADPKPDSTSALKAVLTPFGEPAVFFLLGGMFLGQAMQRHGLDRRFALGVLSARGMSRSPGTVLLSVGLAVGLISMAVSNTAATAIVLPVVLKILDLFDETSLRQGAGERKISQSRYGAALLLMTAYAAGVGGIATPIGTTTNVVAMGFFKRAEYFAQEVNFLRWMTLGVPLSLVLFALLFALLRWYGRGLQTNLPALRQQLFDMQQALGSWKPGERNTLLVFLAAMLGWIMPGLIGLFNEETGKSLQARLPEELVAILVPVMLYLLPVPATDGDHDHEVGTLTSDDLRGIDWGALLLFGAGLSLGSLVKQTGLAVMLADRFIEFWPNPGLWGIIGAMSLAAIILSEFSSNAAAATILIPIVWALCERLKLDPLGPQMATVLAASFGSALPVSTPPNTLVYSTKRITIRRMASVGLVFDVLCWVVVTVGVILAISCKWSPWL